MIQLGRYDAFDKWNIVCRCWAGEEIDAGQDRFNRPCTLHWQSEAIWGGRRYCERLVELKRELVAASDVAAAGIHAEIAGLVREIGYSTFRARAHELAESIQREGFVRAAADLPSAITEHLKEAFKFGALMSLHYTEDVDEIPDIETLRAKRYPFPRQVLVGKRKVLDLFCARQYGILDAIHIYDAAPETVTLVDLDPACLDVMKRIYPSEWTYVSADYKAFLCEAEAQGLVYDLVTADPWEGMCEEVGFDMFPAVAGRCSDTIVIHYLQRMFDALGAGLDDFAVLSRAIRRRTGVDVEVIDWVRRSFDNGYLVMRKHPDGSG